MSIVTIDHLTYTYGGADTPALRDVSLTIEAGEWVVLQGVTGSGKSTLLKSITGACPAFYGGSIAGKVCISGTPILDIGTLQRVKTIGFVGQDPEAQAVYSEAGHEIAFSLENIGVRDPDMNWRVAEALELVGLSDFAHRSTESVSGGERQRLALAAALVHQPQILVLDEPTSQLDPLAANELLDHLRRLQHDFGMTIILSEHRLDAVYSLADRVVVLSQGAVSFTGTARETATWLRARDVEQAPTLVRLFCDAQVPALSVREAKQRLYTVLHSRGEPESAQPSAKKAEEVTRTGTEHMFVLSKVTAKYRGAESAALQDCSVKIPAGSITAVIGPNGSGKSTLLRVLCGLLKPVRGKVLTPAERAPRVGYLPQNPSELFSQLTVRSELQLGLRLQGVSDIQLEARTQSVATQLQLMSLLDKGPRDLSGGEQMRVALASLLMDHPTVLLLDEPTRGLDAAQKQVLGQTLKQLTTENQLTVVFVSHDMEFVAETALDVVFMSLGAVALEGPPRQVFTKSLYFSPPVARVFRGLADDVLSLEDAIDGGWAR